MKPEQWTAAPGHTAFRGARDPVGLRRGCGPAGEQGGLRSAGFASLLSVSTRSPWFGEPLAAGASGRPAPIPPSQRKTLMDQDRRASRFLWAPTRPLPCSGELRLGEQRPSSPCLPGPSERRLT